MDEQQIMELITKEFTWDQVLYQIVAWEGLDPWDLDLVKLTNSFFNYISAFREINFRIPAKFLMIASMLLRMKCDHLSYTGEDEEPVIEDGGEAEAKGFLINDVTFPPTRQSVRRLVVDDLVVSLRRVLKAYSRRERKERLSRGKINIQEDNITRRIAMLYERINSILGRIKHEEVRFSRLVERWERPEVFNTFLPLLYLDNEKKVDCRQEKIFDEIFIKKGRN